MTLTAEREQEIRERVAKAWLVDAKDAEIKLLLDALTAARVENERLREDAPYIVGWNAGFEHAMRETLKMQFPTMLRKMWSGEEVQSWLSEKIEAARNALGGDNG